jgi:hypothetical protein
MLRVLDYYVFVSGINYFVVNTFFDGRFFHHLGKFPDRYFALHQTETARVVTKIRIMLSHSRHKMNKITYIQKNAESEGHLRRHQDFQFPLKRNFCFWLFIAYLV